MRLEGRARRLGLDHEMARPLPDRITLPALQERVRPLPRGQDAAGGHPGRADGARPVPGQPGSGLAADHTRRLEPGTDKTPPTATFTVRDRRAIDEQKQTAPADREVRQNDTEPHSHAHLLERFTTPAPPRRRRARRSRGTPAPAVPTRRRAGGSPLSARPTRRHGTRRRGGRPLGSRDSSPRGDRHARSLNGACHPGLRLDFLSPPGSTLR
jgi:hypothetical protein